MGVQIFEHLHDIYMERLAERTRRYFDRNIPWNEYATPDERMAGEYSRFNPKATYSPKLSARGKAQHAPLANALREFAGARNKEALLKLLSPIHAAAETSSLVKELEELGLVFHP